MDWWQPIAAVVGGLLLVWFALLVAMLLVSRGRVDRLTALDALRLGPDVLRLTRRLVADRSLPRAVRWWLGALLLYLLSPIDLVPDFLPVIGFLDDAIVVAIVLGFATRRAGGAAIDRHWPGTDAGLAALRSVLRLPSA